MVSWRRFIPVLIVLFLLQTSFVCRYTFGVFRVDLLCLLAIFIALEADYTPTLIAAFVIGLARDLGSIGPLGMGPLIFVPVAAGIIALRHFLLRDTFFTDMVLAGLGVLAIGLTAGALTALATPGPQIGALTVQAFGQAAMSLAAWPIIYISLDASKLVGESIEQFSQE